MNSFAEKFKIEVEEYCERLETGLLQLEHDFNNQQVISEIFRIMHTMKGSGGMFGFDLLSEVTHDLESLFEIFRSGSHVVDSEVISFALKSVDRIKELMVEEPTPENRMVAGLMREETRQQIARFKGVEPDIQKMPFSNPGNDVVDQTRVTYFISFVPDENILENGTNPLYLIDEFHALGECNVQVSLDQLPDLKEIDPLKCYISWYLFIATSESLETLNDVFLFVSSHSKVKIEKVANSNVIHNEMVLANFLNAQSNNETLEATNPEITINEVIDPVDDQAGVDGLAPNFTKDAESSKPFVFGQTKVDSIRVDSGKIDRYINLVSEFITAQSHLEQIISGSDDPELKSISESWAKLNRQLRDNAFDMSLIPLQSVMTRLKRLVFDLSRSLNKDVELLSDGMDTELDKNIIEKITEPLLHLIRNSIDHGIEEKVTRLSLGKNPVGHIFINALTIGSYVQIEIEDDGNGLDLEKIRNKAVQNGLIAVPDHTPDDDLLQLIFEHGFSTAEIVTDVSGRGVGLDVVKKSIQSMNGSVEVLSVPGQFTRFIIKLPLSLSIIDGLLTRVGKNYYVIPSAVVNKLYSVSPRLMKKEFRQVVELDGVQFPYLNLREEFDPVSSLPDEQHLIAVSYGNQQFGLIVDEVVREYQAVIKPLGRMLQKQEVFSGANILGSGDLALVIDTNKLIQKYS